MGHPAGVQELLDGVEKKPTHWNWAQNPKMVKKKKKILFTEEELKQRGEVSILMKENEI